MPPKDGPSEAYLEAEESAWRKFAERLEFYTEAVDKRDDALTTAAAKRLRDSLAEFLKTREAKLP